MGKKTLTIEEERDLSRRWKAGDRRALDEMVRANYGLAISFAQSFHRPGRNDIDDLAQEALFGLTVGCQHFDPDRGVKLGTYCSWWIRAHLYMHVIDYASPVRLSGTKNGRTVFFGMKRVQHAIVIGGGRVEIDPQVLAKKLDVKVEDVVDMAQWIVPSSRVDLDAQWSEENPESRQDLLHDSDGTPEENVSRKEQLEFVRAFALYALRHLSERERVIVEERLLSDEPLTLQAIGQHYGITRERARQIEVNAKQKFDHFVKRRAKAAGIGAAL